MKTTLLKMAFVFFSLTSVSGASDLNSAFNIYHKSYQSNDFETTKSTIEEALKSDTHNSYLIYNLGLTEYKLGKTGLAIGLWRKALSINPQLNDARQALDYAISQMPAKPLAKTTDSTWVWLEKLIVDYLSFNVLWPLFLISLFVSGYMFIKYLGAKKKAFANDEAPPILGTKPVLFLMITLCLGALSFFSFTDLVTTKATAIAKPTEIKTGPSADYGTLFEIPEGTEVLIRDKEAEWYKIEDPTGRVGWAMGDQLFLTNSL